MARTRWGDWLLSSLKENWPLASVLVRPDSSMPWPSERRTTSSPASGLPVVLLVTMPVRVWAEAKAAVTSSEQARSSAENPARGREWTGENTRSFDLRAFDLRSGAFAPPLRITSWREGWAAPGMTDWRDGEFKMGFL